MKKSHKKSVHPSSSKSPKKILIKKSTALLAVIIIAILALFFFRLSQPGIAAKITAPDDASFVVKITEERVDVLYNSLSANAPLTKRQILDRLIDTKVLVHYIAVNGYALTDEEVNQIIELKLAESKKTMADLEADLKLNGATLDDVKDNVQLENYATRHLAPMIKITNEQIANYKLRNPSSTLTDEEIKMGLFSDTQEELIKEIIKLHKTSLSIKIVNTYT